MSGIFRRDLAKARMYWYTLLASGKLAVRKQYRENARRVTIKLRYGFCSEKITANCWHGFYKYSKGCADGPLPSNVPEIF